MSREPSTVGTKEERIEQEGVHAEPAYPNLSYIFKSSESSQAGEPEGTNQPYIEHIPSSPPPGLQANNTIQPTTQHITFSPCTIVTTPITRTKPQTHRPNQRPQMDQEPLSPHHHWTHELNERERKLLAEETHIRSIETDLTACRKAWDEYHARDAQLVHNRHVDIEAACQLLAYDAHNLHTDWEALHTETKTPHSR